ncbi:MAG: DUF6508 domain-containing protein [Gaiellaceae bacterium]
MFDWLTWEPEAKRLTDVGGIEQADLLDLRRLLTMLVRSDRFRRGTARLGDGVGSDGAHPPPTRRAGTDGVRARLT